MVTPSKCTVGLVTGVFIALLLVGTANSYGSSPQEKTGKPKTTPKVVPKNDPKNAPGSEQKTVPRIVSKPLPRPVDYASGRALIFNGGVTVPVSKKGLTEFWGYGPGFSLGFLTHIRDSTRAYVNALGFGVDVSVLRFRSDAFQSRFPTVELREKNLTFIHAYIAWKFLLHRTKRFSPFIGATAGISQLTGATYREIIDSVRVTYYDVPARIRLTIGMKGGIDIGLSSGFSVEAEGSWVYVHNDPNIGLGFSLRLGGRVKF